MVSLNLIDPCGNNPVTYKRSKNMRGYRTKSVDNELLQGDTIRQQVQPFCQDFLFWFNDWCAPFRVDSFK